MRMRSLLVLALSLAVCGSAFADRRARLPDPERATEVRMRMVDTRDAAEYPTVAEDQKRPSKINPLYDCYGGCMIRYACNAFSGECLPNPQGWICSYMPGVPPCVCYEICDW